MFVERREISICITKEEKDAFLKVSACLDNFAELVDEDDYYDLERQMEKWCGRENLMNGLRDGLSYILRYATVINE